MIDPSTGRDASLPHPHTVDPFTQPQPHYLPQTRAAPGTPPENTSFYGLHIITAMLMFALDQMMSAMEIASFGLLIFVSFIIGAAAILPCYLIQRYVAKQSAGAALGVALAVSLLTMVPTGLPGFLTLGWAGLTAIHNKRNGNPPEIN
jgi:hypothetical protein